MNSTPKPPPLRASDLRAIWQLAHQATGEVIDITEAMHQSVRATLGLPAGLSDGPQSLSHRRTAGLTGAVYRSVRGISRLGGAGVQAALERLEPWLAQRFSALASAEGAPPSVEREALLAALNGVMGDRLQAMGNPLATRMQLLARDGQAWRGLQGQVSGLVLFIHGLCMNDLQWQISPHTEAAPAKAWGTPRQAAQARVDMGAALESERGLQPIYLRYNSGRHVADNGAELAALLEAQLGSGAASEPPLHIVAHSMGGLLARSAIEQARRSGMQWPHRVQHLVCLGTPHHGAPLERAGNWVDAILGALPFAAPIGRLAQLRSAGITDLRHGLVLPEDLPAAATPASGELAQAKPGKDRFSKTPDTRTPLPLPTGMACHTVAATTAARRSALAERLLGDGLVPLRSALGQHPQIAHRLAFSEANQRVFFGMNHFELLQHPEVVAQVAAWLQPEPNAA